MATNKERLDMIFLPEEERLNIDPNEAKYTNLHVVLTYFTQRFSSHTFLGDSLIQQTFIDIFFMRYTIWGIHVLNKHVENLSLTVTLAARKSWLKKGIIKKKKKCIHTLNILF